MTDELPSELPEGFNPQHTPDQPASSSRILDSGDPQAITEAAEAVAAGRCIVIPTDTVYGIGADAFSSSAVQHLLDAKQRGHDQPPPVLVAEPGMLRALTTAVPAAALELAEAFWPGALTLILQSQRSLKLEIGDTGGTVAVRVPDHRVARELLRRTGPLAVSSANLSGKAPAMTAQQAHEQLGDSVTVYLDAGPAPGGVASTIIDFSQDPHGCVVRDGAIAFDDLVKIVPGLTPITGAEDLPGAADAPAAADSDDSAGDDFREESDPEVMAEES